MISSVIKYPEQFNGLKDSAKDKGINFNAIKTFTVWDMADGYNGLDSVINNDSL